MEWSGATKGEDACVPGVGKGPVRRALVSENNTLTELQISILEILWEAGPASTQDVHAVLEQARPLAVSTVATLLSRLERRGILERWKDGRQFMYRAVVSREDVRHSMVADLTETLFRGDPASLISHLVASHEVDGPGLARIRQLIESAESVGPVGEADG